MPSPAYGAWPASTGWLIASILFANKLWIGDVTSMSLYWVARLPIKRPKASSPLAQKSAGDQPEQSAAFVSAVVKCHTRQRKIALSLAIVAAFAAPFVFRTYQAK